MDGSFSIIFITHTNISAIDDKYQRESEASGKSVYDTFQY